MKELCAALAEAERGGHAFIALKWFRDSFLPRKAFRWNQHPESRQAVLAEAIQRGVVLTSKIANPKTPAYPTTTIRLNRAEAGIPEEAQRFHPVAMHGVDRRRIEEERGALSCYFLSQRRLQSYSCRSRHRRPDPPDGDRRGQPQTHPPARRWKSTRPSVSGSAPAPLPRRCRRRTRNLRLEAARTVQEPLNPAVLESARQLLDRSALRWPDALQLGAAIIAREMFQGTEIIFVSASPDT